MESATTASEFTYKTYRCEWQIYAHVVGQFDEYADDSDVTVFESFPTYGEAKANVEKYLVKHEFSSRVLPIGAQHTYWRCGVRYMEVFVDDK